MLKSSSRRQSVVQSWHFEIRSTFVTWLALSCSMQPSTNASSLDIADPVVITDAWSGEPKLAHLFEPARPEDALLNVAQGLVRWCRNSLVQWLSLWLQQKVGVVVVDDLSPTVLQQLDVLVASFTELQRQQQVLHTALEGLQYRQKCCCEAANHFASLRTLQPETTTRRRATQEDRLIVQEMDDYVELNFEDAAKVEEASDD